MTADNPGACKIVGGHSVQRQRILYSLRQRMVDTFQVKIGAPKGGRDDLEGEQSRESANRVRGGGDFKEGIGDGTVPAIRNQPTNGTCMAEAIPRVWKLCGA